MLISVVVIFYNQKRYVNRALGSVIQQTYSNMDIIVVDDGSDENIEDAVAQFDDPRIQFFRKENGGPASARNLGIEEARGQYIAFLDGDDVFLPNKIEHMTALLRRRDYPVCVLTSDAYVVNEKNHFTGRIRSQEYVPGEIINTAVLRPSFALYHKEIFGKCGGFPETLKTGEDGAFNIIVTQHVPVFRVPEFLTLYRMTDSGLARQHLSDYEKAVDRTRARVDFVSAHVNAEPAAEYEQLAFRGLLYGFLSAGNLSAAKKWSNQVDASVVGLLAKISIQSGANVYLFARRIRRGLSRLLLLPVQARLRKYL